MFFFLFFFLSNKQSGIERLGRVHAHRAPNRRDLHDIQGGNFGSGPDEGERDDTRNPSHARGVPLRYPRLRVFRPEGVLDDRRQGVERLRRHVARSRKCRSHPGRK